MSKAFTFRLPEGLMASVDERRGDVPRTRFVVRALEAALAPGSSGAAQSASPRTSEKVEKAPVADASNGPHAQLAPSESVSSSEATKATLAASLGTGVRLTAEQGARVRAVESQSPKPRRSLTGRPVGPIPKSKP